jgi:hypothetical protein
MKRWGHGRTNKALRGLRCKMIGYKARGGLSTRCEWRAIVQEGIDFQRIGKRVFCDSLLSDDSASRGLDERSDLRGILSARYRLDAAGDVDHPGFDEGDSGGHVFGRQAAGQD